ncbi:MAG: hypothetical protein AABZ53_00730 [Planctomycetota bacterium]
MMEGSPANPQQSGSPHKVSAWLHPAQARLVGVLGDACGLSITRAGGPVDHHRVCADLSAGAAVDDARRMFVEAETQAVLLFDTTGMVGGKAGDEARHVGAAISRGVKVISLDPIPGTAFEPAGAETGLGGLLMLASMRTMPAMREAGELLQSFGHPTAMIVEAIAGSGETSMGSRLFDAMGMVFAVMGEAESVAAAYVPATTLGGGPPGETLRDLRGTLSATLRFSDGRSASVVASDRGAAWRRSATMLSARGRFTMSDDGFEWRDESGVQIDSWAAKAPTGPAAGWRAAEVMGESLSRLLDPLLSAEPKIDTAGVMCLCQTALLSCRTMQMESLSTVKRMVG